MAQVTSEGPGEGPHKGAPVCLQGTDAGDQVEAMSASSVLRPGLQERFEQRPDRLTGFPLALCVLRLSCTTVNPVVPAS